MHASWLNCCARIFCALCTTANGVRTLKELSRSYLAISGDLVRVMTRLKAVYRSWASPCAGK